MGDLKALRIADVQNTEKCVLFKDDGAQDKDEGAQDTINCRSFMTLIDALAASRATRGVKRDNEGGRCKCPESTMQCPTTHHRRMVRAQPSSNETLGAPQLVL
eukprot:467879-Amphidinium_carterae.2